MLGLWYLTVCRIYHYLHVDMLRDIKELIQLNEYALVILVVVISFNTAHFQLRLN